LSTLYFIKTAKVCAYGIFFYQIKNRYGNIRSYLSLIPQHIIWKGQYERGRGKAKWAVRRDLTLFYVVSDSYEDGLNRRLPSL
jgi:hypothetical protein